MAVRMGVSTRLKAFLQQGRLDDARVIVHALPFEAVYDRVNDFPPRCALALCSLLEPERRDALIDRLSPRELRRILSGATVEEVYGLCTALTPDFVPCVLRALPAKRRGQVLKKLPDPLKRELHGNDDWPADSVGAIMSDAGVSVSPDDTVAEVYEKMREQAPDRDLTYACFVIEDRVFQGTVALEDMVLTTPDTKMSELVDSDCHEVSPLTDRAEAARLMSRYDCQLLPVVSGRTLLGVLPFSDVLDAMEDENTELLHFTGGLYGENERGSVLGEAKRRLPCLLLCLIAGIMTTGVMEHYESLLSQVVALSFFVPLLMDTGGNVGAQISVLLIRSIGLGTLDESHLGRVLIRETVTAFILGVTMAVLAAGRSVMLDTGFAVSVTVSFAMIAVVFVANMLGTVMPFFIKRLGLDPAIFSGPLLATIVDVVGLVVYFAIASMILL